MNDKRYYSLNYIQISNNQTFTNNECYIFNLYYILFVDNSLIFYDKLLNYTIQTQQISKVQFRKNKSSEELTTKIGEEQSPQSNVIINSKNK